MLRGDDRSCSKLTRSKKRHEGTDEDRSCRCTRTHHHREKQGEKEHDHAEHGQQDAEDEDARPGMVNNMR